MFDLYGGFAVEGDRSGALRLSTILRLGEDLGIRSAATRAAAMRMVDRGWLEVDRKPRESIYRLTSAGRQLIDQGRKKIFSHSSMEWDHKWCLVAVSVPEAHREVRDRLRKELSWLGFGSPSPGLYISPHDHAASVARIAGGLGAGDWIQVYRATSERPDDPFDLVQHGWADLSAVNRRYERFLTEFSQLMTSGRAKKSIAPVEAFRVCFALLSEYRRCIYADPALPQELLPARWSGTAARTLFIGAHAELINPALRHFDAVLISTGGTRSISPLLHA